MCENSEFRRTHMNFIRQWQVQQTEAKTWQCEQSVQSRTIREKKKTNSPPKRQQQSKIARWHNTPRSKLITVINNGRHGNADDDRMIHSIFCSRLGELWFVTSHISEQRRIVRWSFGVQCDYGFSIKKKCVLFLFPGGRNFTNISFFGRPGIYVFVCFWYWILGAFL